MKVLLDEKELKMLREAKEQFMATPAFHAFVARVDTIRQMRNLPNGTVLSVEGDAFIVPDDAIQGLCQ